MATLAVQSADVANAGPGCLVLLWWMDGKGLGIATRVGASAARGRTTTTSRRGCKGQGLKGIATSHLKVKGGRGGPEFAAPSLRGASAASRRVEFRAISAEFWQVAIHHDHPARQGEAVAAALLHQDVADPVDVGVLLCGVLGADEEARG